MYIIEIIKYNENVRRELNRLLPQLSSVAGVLTADDLTQMIQSDSAHLLMAEQDDRYLGTLTLIKSSAPRHPHRWYGRSCSWRHRMPGTARPVRSHPVRRCGPWAGLK